MKLKNLTMGVLLTASLTACSSAKTESQEEIARTPETENLFKNLINISKTGYLYGHHDDPCYGHTWKFEDDRSDVKEVCGDYPGLMTFDMGHIELDSTVNLDGVPFELIRQETLKQYERGGVVSYSWHLNNPKTGGDAWDVKDSTVVASILEDGENHEKFLGWLDKLATFLNSVETEEGVKVPIIFRPWHEHTGSWFWWGQDLCTTEQYKALWKMTVDQLQKDGVKNLLFAYSPGSEPNGEAEKYLERYPGDDIIDVLGLDTYCYGDPKDPMTIANYIKSLETNLGMICQLAQEKHKIAALTETGLESIPIANYWTAAFENVCDRFPISYAQTWRNAHDKPEHFYAPFKGQESADDFVEFYKSPKSLFAGDLKDLYK